MKNTNAFEAHRAYGHISGELFCVHHQTWGRKNFLENYLFTCLRQAYPDSVLNDDMSKIRAIKPYHCSTQTGHVTISTQTYCRVLSTGGNGFTADAEF